jgi:hypothetical protein
VTTQAPPLRQSRDNFGGIYTDIYIYIQGANVYRYSMLSLSNTLHPVSQCTYMLLLVIIRGVQNNIQNLKILVIV